MRTLHDLPAPAKINRFLHVVGRRADGYHLLESVFQALDWSDTLHLELRDDGVIARTDLGEPVPAEDLCILAARALQAESGIGHGVQIHLDKRLPSGAGLGGGSSDAATVLLGLNRLWKLHWPRERLMRIGAALGADVPFFLGRGPAFVHGIGEALVPLRLPESDLVVLKPRESLPTAQIFRDPALKRDTASILLGLPNDGGLVRERDISQRVQELLAGDAGWGHNDLQPVAQAQCPAVGAAQQWLTARFGNGRMTGSGSAVFARSSQHPTPSDPQSQLMADFAAGDVAAIRLAGATARSCRTLVEHPLAAYAQD